MNPRAEDLSEAAREELDRACTMTWAQLAAVVPYGDTFEGFTPQGRTVCFERSYLWEDDNGGDIRVEVNVYEPKAFEKGVRMTGSIPRFPADPA
jgi:hypothetical protein